MKIPSHGPPNTKKAVGPQNVFWSVIHEFVNIQQVLFFLASRTSGDLNPGAVSVQKFTCVSDYSQLNLKT